MDTSIVSPRATRRPAFVWPPMAVAAIVLGCALLIALQPIDVLVRHIKDDCYYYLKTANNIALGRGSTFDGINPTNGYHPLWMLNVIPIYWVFPAAPLAALRAVVLLIALYHTAAAVILYQIGQRIVGVATAMVMALAWALLPFVLRISFSGMEAALYAVLLVALIRHVVLHFKNHNGSWGPPSGLRPYAVTGLLLALCALARLDAVFFFGGLLLTLGMALARQRGLRAAILPLVALALPVIILLGTYLLSNLAIFGHLYPVSALIKSPAAPHSLLELLELLLWPVMPLYRRIGLLPAALALVIAMALGIAALGLSPALRALVMPSIRRYDWLWIGATLLYSQISISKTYIANWYYAPFLLLLALALGELLARLWRAINMRLPIPHAVGVPLLAAIGGLYLLIAAAEFNPRKNDTVYETLRAAEWVKANLPPDAISGAWNAGVLGYFSERTVVNLDGLINSYAYYQAMQQGQAHEFALREGVAYVFDMYPAPAGDSAMFYPDAAWMPYLEPFYERRYHARNVGLSSYFKNVFPQPEQDSQFMFKVWKVVRPPA